LDLCGREGGRYKLHIHPVFVAAAFAAAMHGRLVSPRGARGYFVSRAFARGALIACGENALGRFCPASVSRGQDEARCDGNRVSSKGKLLDGKLLNEPFS
jgi:hypothetical protein